MGLSFCIVRFHSDCGGCVLAIGVLFCSVRVFSNEQVLNDDDNDNGDNVSWLVVLLHLFMFAFVSSVGYI